MSLPLPILQFLRAYPRLTVLVAVLAVAASIGSVFAYRYLSFHLWLEEDSANLDDYSYFIIREGNRLEHTDTPALERLFDDEIVRNETRDRIVLDLSRSNIRYERFGRKAYTKCLLRTGIPHNGGKTIRVKFLAIGERQGDGWHYVGRQNLTIE